MKKIIYLVLFGITSAVFFAAGYLLRSFWLIPRTPPVEKIIPLPKPLEVYSFDNLSQNQIPPGTIVLGEIVEKLDQHTSYIFTFEFKPNPQKDEVKKTTGLINIPHEGLTFPAILMLRGYIDQQIYTTGVGTKNAGNFFAANGFLTLAPDFLGYAGSDDEAANIFEARFQTYTATLALLKTLEATPRLKVGDKEINIGPVGIWGHSNGGQIALTVLEITGKSFPTVLWAPVSKPFPYSILYYTDESHDRGKLIRAELAKFENLYDVENYSLTNYFHRISAETALQIHQGSADAAVPQSWTDQLSQTLIDLNLEPDYFIYPNADHNLRPGWDTVVSRSLIFFQQNLR